jgi:biopolymer transport protein ExbB
MSQKRVFNRTTGSLTLAAVVVLAASPILAQGFSGQPGDSGISAPGAADRQGMLPHREGETAIAERNLITIVQQGGPLMVPILMCSFVLCLFTFERMLSLRRRRVIPRPFVRKFLHQLRDRALDEDEALELCRDNGSAVAQVFAGAVQKWGRSAVEVEQGIIDAGERVTNGLRRHLRVLNGVATVSPLLGLLGTVLGMIQAFNDIATADAMGKPELLAAGIGQALITTASGLTVAIPALIFYMFFLSRVDRLVMDIDSVAQKVVAEISAEALSKPKGRSRKRAAA